MAYLTIGATNYLVRLGQGRGQVQQIEQRRRAIDGTLLVDAIATKRVVTVEITGTVSSGRFFTPGEADALMASLASGSLSVSGDLGSFTARARDIGFVDGQTWNNDGSASVYRFVSVTLEQV